MRAELAVQLVVGRVVAEDVVARNVLLRLHDADREVVVVEQRLAAGVGGQRVESLLLVLELRPVRRAPNCPVYMPEPPGEALVASPRGAEATQAARVDRVERNVGADGGVDGGLELRLVVHAVALHAAGEIDQRLLLVQRAEHLDGGFQRGQLTVRVEDLEFGSRPGESGGRRRRRFVAVGAVQPLALADDQVVDVLDSRSRSSVKSSTTLMSLEKVMMAIRSDLVIWVLHEFLGRGLGADLVGMGMEVMSKNMTMRRLSLYLMSPGFSGAIWLAATAS